MSEPNAGDIFALKFGVFKVQGQLYALQHLFDALLVIIKQKDVLDDHEVSVLINAAETTLSDSYSRMTQGIPQGADQVNEMKAASDAIFSSLREVITEAGENPQSSD
jgi:hypothetical protein